MSATPQPQSVKKSVSWIEVFSRLSSVALSRRVSFLGVLLAVVETPVLPRQRPGQAHKCLLVLWLKLKKRVRQIEQHPGGPQGQGVDRSGAPL